jgi:DNA-binding PadR family transcriptional regulator
VSSIRLFVLGSLAMRGPMHGHGLRLLAEEEHIDMWTDFTAGAIYGVIKRLLAEGLIEEERVERDGNYPERQILKITRDGHIALAKLRVEGLEEIVLRPDPFDLAFARLDRDALDDVPESIERRLSELRSMLASREAHARRIDKYLTKAERAIFSHTPARLRAEIAWHEELLATLPAIIEDEKSRKGHTE